VADPDWPGVRVSVPAVVDEGEIFEMATVNSHSVAMLTTIAGVDVEAA
jgi:hypothetical protein